MHRHLLFRSRQARSLALATGLLAALLSGCSKGEGGGPPPQAPTEVVIAKPSLAPVEEVITAVGTIEANERVEIKPEAPGLVQTIHFVEGQRVKKDDLLFELDSHKESATVAQAAAEEKLARASVSRARSLMGTKAISQQEVEQWENQVAVKEAAQQLEMARLTERRILAPFDGVVGPRLISPGQYVTAGTPLVTLVDHSQVKIRFRVPERQLAQIRKQQQGRVRVSAYPDRAFAGTVDLINPEVDASTRTVEIRLIAPNEDELLKPGMFARVELVVGLRERAVVIPEGALVPSLERFSVFVVEDGTARLRPAQIGVRLPGQAEIREGLSIDELIVISGTQKLIDGMKVVAAKTNAAAAAQP